MLRYRVRPAELDDLAACVEIDASYITTYVWQLQESFEEPFDDEEENSAASAARPAIVGKSSATPPPAFRVEFSPSRLPRPLAIAAPLNDQQLLAEWKKTDHLLVAEAVEPPPPPPEPLPEGEETPESDVPAQQPAPQGKADIIGYIGLTVDGPRHVAWISTCAVQLDYRRRGVGTQLLKEARVWADRYRLRSLMIEIQTKNYPAISFFQKNGFFFCGYNNAYYPTREIALFFGKRLEKFT
ncbi:MAG TPA: GNAT family N-acetyltransferase [Chloroflexia bacterium]|nr:GNAT family N-acetyltransferase [Chloroflexia bacterium]